MYTYIVYQWFPIQTWTAKILDWININMSLYILQSPWRPHKLRQGHSSRAQVTLPNLGYNNVITENGDFFSSGGFLSHGGKHLWSSLKKKNIPRWDFTFFLNHPAIGDPPWLWKPIYGDRWCSDDFPLIQSAKMGLYHWWLLCCDFDWLQAAAAGSSLLIHTIYHHQLYFKTI